MRPFRTTAIPLLSLLVACGGSEAPGDSAANPSGESPASGVPVSAPDSALPVEPDAETPSPVEDVGLDGDWQREPVTGGGASQTVLLQAVRTARHDGYDRIVLEFDGAVPEYAVQYASPPLHQCGSGRPVELDSGAILQIELRGTNAHTEQGEPTVADRDRSPGLPVLEQARLTCDFEAVVEWVLGLDQRVPFRVLTLQDPPRLVVDLRHP